MIFSALKIDGAFKIDLDKKEDSRGFFARQYCNIEFENNGLNTNWVQMNMSFSKSKGTLRGMHFQREPKAEIKMVRCIRGAIFDVIVDLRKNSKSYGENIATELSAENRSMIYIPKGFAHGFQTLTENVELLYWHSECYSLDHEGGLNPLDNSIKSIWPVNVSDISNRDTKHPLLNNLEPIQL